MNVEGTGEPAEADRLRRIATRLWDNVVVRAVVVLGAVLAAVALWGVITASPLQAAYDTCREDYSMGLISVTGGGDSITVNGIGAESSPMTEEWKMKQFDGMVCLLNELETSGALIQDMDSTTSLMGRQSASENDLIYRWSYHPDSGILMTIRRD